MRNVGGPGYYWTAEGFFMEELFSRDGSGPVYADSQVVVTRTRRPPGLRFAGEVDITNSDAVAQAIRIGLGDSSHAHVDVSGLSFIDVSGIRAMVEAANELGEGRQLLVHGAAPQLEMVMHVTGLAELPSVVLCRCGAESR
ncbi:MAG TPA: STAS domain-containing protein [Candidatus Dormibacteraeota bacterium]|nr:STAS domain-containing protein [Candidatus Dormibacteraeota bacterium]